MSEVSAQLDSEGEKQLPKEASKSTARAIEGFKQIPRYASVEQQTIFQDEEVPGGDKPNSPKDLVSVGFYKASKRAQAFGQASLFQ